ncbi:hypothetical protein HDU97_010001 [Phlyctochytrium planicorne]|nr:hypothetical protein HDU97_010001 [Phlyctochytrium planicorne]
MSNISDVIPVKSDYINALTATLTTHHQTHLQHPSLPHQTLSIDVGIIHIGLALLISTPTSPAPTLLQWQVLPLFPTPTPFVPSAIAKATSTLLDKILPSTPLTSVVIERQHWSHRTATALPIIRCSSVESSLFSTLHARYRLQDPPLSLESIPPRSVAVHFGFSKEGELEDRNKRDDGNPNRYAAKKKKAVAMVRDWVEGKGQGGGEDGDEDGGMRRRVHIGDELREQFLGWKKRDDGADALMLGVAYCEWVKEREREIKEILKGEKG